METGPTTLSANPCIAPPAPVIPIHCGRNDTPFLILANRLLRSSLSSDVDQPLAKSFRRLGRYH
jgi:hypothetical protein